jgi:predicted lipid-binding transport protein (Tim44 family)
MRQSIVAVSLIGILAGGVALTSLSEARVGGGGSSGSRGSRSYSAPRVPSSPITPSTPASPRPSAPAPGPLAQGPRPGLFGGLGGMVGGFILGGVLGSLLFGGLGGMSGGIGFMDILVVGGLAALVISFLRRRTPEPAPAGASGYGRVELPPAMPGSASVEAPAGGTAPGGSASLDEDLARGVDHIRTMDPEFDPARFLAVAKDLFVRLQIGWSGGDLAAVRAHLTDEMAVALEGDIARLREKGRRNRIDQVAVDSVALTEAWQEHGRDLLTAEIRAGAMDYVVDEATGQVVEGSATKPTRFVEFWTFVRPVGPNPWRLGAIQQPSA